jgi:hypothetical protein
MDERKGREVLTRFLEAYSEFYQRLPDGEYYGLGELRAAAKEAEAALVSDECPHLSLDGIDASKGPNKIWRCSMCNGLFKERESGGLRKYP